MIREAARQTPLANSAGTAPVRLHWIDWLRVAAIAGVFVYHTLRPFNTDDWHVKNVETSALLNDLTTFFFSFGLAVLFLMAGAGVRFALRRRTWQTFLKDIIVAAGGLKVFPTEIEDVLSTHRAVRLAAVIGVPVGSPDQRAKAFVVIREGARPDAHELLDFLRERLAAYKVPKVIEFRDQLPLAFTGKVLRRVLAAEERAQEALRAQ